MALEARVGKRDVLANIKVGKETNSLKKRQCKQKEKFSNYYNHDKLTHQTMPARLIVNSALVFGEYNSAPTVLAVVLNAPH